MIKRSAAVPVAGRVASDLLADDLPTDDTDTGDVDGVGTAAGVGTADEGDRA